MGAVYSNKRRNHHERRDKHDTLHNNGRDMRARERSDRRRSNGAAELPQVDGVREGNTKIAAQSRGIGGEGMREILFRGKRIDNGEWIYGDVVQFPIHGIVRIVEQEPSYKDAEVDLDTVGQYTGLTDKNGKKIFEGDILKIIHKYQSPFDDDTKEYTDITTDVVFFDDEGLCFSYGKSPFLCVVDNVTAEYEVVGNIHDNPELLEVTE